MENKDVNKGAVNFDNLKKLNSIINSSEIGDLSNNIKDSKMLIDTFCKTLKEKSSKLEKLVIEKKVENEKFNTTPTKVVETSTPKTSFTPNSETISNTNKTETVSNVSSQSSNNKPLGNDSYNNNRAPQTGAYNRPNDSQGNGYDRNQNSSSTYNRPQGTGYNRNNNENGYNNSTSASGTTGGYNNNRPQTGTSTTGGYSRPPYINNNGGTGGYNRGPQTGGYNNNRPQTGTGSTGSYTRPPYGSGNGTNGGYNRGPQTGGYNNNRPQNAGGTTGGYSRPPYTNNNGGTTGGYNRGPQTGGYSRPPYANNNSGTTGGYNRGPQTGGYNNNRPGQGGFNRPAGAPGTRPAGYKPSTTTLDTLQVKPERNLNKAKSKPVEKETKGLNIKAKIRMGFIEIDSADENEERMGRVRVKGKKAKEVRQPERINIENAKITTDNLTVKILSEKIGKPVSDIVKKFMLLGMMLNINSVIDFDTAELVANEFGITLEKNIGKTAEESLLEDHAKTLEDETGNKKRPPIVTVMGHVDHGKTSLLDAIKKTNVISSEAGGITQHIGAYSVNVNNNKITFIDTPGHEAFTSMRKRGAQVTDIAILVVAADDGIMPQTVEAIKHIKQAKVPMIVAINKIDKPDANIERIKQQLTEHEVLPEEWGGDVICVPISAKAGTNIEKLLEMIILVADMQDLKANPNHQATGTVLESKIDKGRGIVATILIKDGSLNVGDYLLCGTASGRVRSMVDYLSKSVKCAEPSMAVSVVGLNSVPDAGEVAYVVDEKIAKNIITERTTKLKIEKTKQTNGITQESFLSQSANTEMKTLKLIIKADVQGSAEAVRESLEKICNEEAQVDVISSVVGGINESDVLMAKASNATIIAFNIKSEAKAKVLADRNNVEIISFKVIYSAVEEITKRITKMLSPKFSENIIGHAEVRHIFKISSIGSIAGSYVLDGTISRNSPIRVKRGDQVLTESTIETLQQGKDDAKTVRSGFECGIKIKGFNDIKEGDIIEVYEKVQIN